MQSGTSFKMILPFDFYTVFKILRCCNLIKHFPNNNKRYSSHSQVLILHTGSNKSLLKIYESPKNSYLKKGSIQGLSYMMTTALGLNLVYSFINFVIPLHSLTYTPFMSLYIGGRGVLAPYFILPTSLFQISSKLLFPVISNPHSHCSFCCPSGKIMCAKLTCKVKYLISQDHFSAEILYYLVERNGVEYNVSKVSESFSLWESKTKA